MKILKFGGTSVGSVKSIRNIKEMLISRIAENESLFVVVSAFGGMTNQLENVLIKSRQGEDYQGVLTEIKTQHTNFIEDLISQSYRDDVMRSVDSYFKELQDVCGGIASLQETTKRSIDKVMSVGERLSSLIIWHFLQQDIENIQLIDPTKIIQVETGISGNEVNLTESSKKAKAYTASLSQLNLCPGFIAANNKGEITTLGRGGSDYTAALFANFYDADVLEIWTDVSGLMTADPRLVPTANLIAEMSFEEALELSHFGASVIYPPSIHPAMVKDIPILIKNTFHPELTGTRISRGFKDQLAVRGVSSIPNITLINLRGSGMVGIPHFSFRLFESLSIEKINVILITQASSEHTICVAIETKDHQRAEEVLNSTFSHEISQGKLRKIEAENNLGILALVGNNMKNQVGISGQMFSSLGRNGVNIRAIAQGASERNISVVIDQSDLIKASNVLHESFFENEIQRTNLFLIGVGTVGSALLEQIENQQEILKDQHLIDLQVIAISNSRKMIFGSQDGGINLSNWEGELKDGEPQTLSTFIERMYQMNLRNSVFLDVTASSDVAQVYSDVLSHSISVVTPNKIAATSSHDEYSLLKKLQRKYKSQFLFETNVCAGLPVISTLSDMIKSGDKIHRIEAVLSGTLNFIFNNYDGTQSFSSIVRKAKEEGYSEPDPRLDLSGKDVMRKILILARESGFTMEMNQIESEMFVPDTCMQAASIEDFFDLVEQEEKHFQKLIEPTTHENSKVRYVAELKGSKATTGLKFIKDDHPFYQLEGSDNIVLFYTERYSEQPLVIKGAGAGAQVTASGIFADIMRITSSN